jgi:hypothetical protein
MCLWYCEFNTKVNSACDIAHFKKSTASWILKRFEMANSEKHQNNHMQNNFEQEAER